MVNKNYGIPGDVFCSSGRNEKCVYISTNKTPSFYDSEKCKACCHVLKTPMRGELLKLTIAGRDGTNHSAKKRVVTEKIGNYLLFRRTFAASHNQPHPNFYQKKQNHSIYGINVSTFHWSIQLTRIFFPSRFIHFQSMMEQHDSLSLQLRC